MTAKEKGLDLLYEKVVQELESVWGGLKLVRCVARVLCLQANIAANLDLRYMRFP